PMRLAMIPLFAVSVLLLGQIGCIVLSRRAGLWAAVFAAVMPRFFFVTTEFRPDVLWAVSWFGVLLVSISGELTAARAVTIGLLIGMGFCISAKTFLLL